MKNIQTDSHQILLVRNYYVYVQAIPKKYTYSLMTKITKEFLIFSKYYLLL